MGIPRPVIARTSSPSGMNSTMFSSGCAMVARAKEEPIPFSPTMRAISAITAPGITCSAPPLRPTHTDGSGSGSSVYATRATP